MNTMPPLVGRALPPTGLYTGLRAPAVALLVGVVLLGLLFRQEAAAAWSVWESSTAYNHCFLILPIAIWLAYDRRRWLSGVVARPVPLVALAVIPIMAAWLIAERLGIMEGRQIMAVAVVELLAIAVLGWRLSWLMGAPLVYLFFLIPFGSFITPALQDFTAHFIIGGLNLLGIANISDGNTIEIAEGIFFVAEACAGLRFLIASIAFGALYAFTFYRDPGRRVAFIAASIVIPILANGLRALGIVVAGHLVGSAQAAAADHLIYGWLFFSFVTLLLILGGLPFRQDGLAEPPAAPVRPSLAPKLSSIAAAVLAVVALAATGPVSTGLLNRAAAAHPVTAPVAIAGCIPAPGQPPGPGTASFDCNGDIHVDLVVFPPRTNPTVIIARQAALTVQSEAEDVAIEPVSGAPAWHFVKTTEPNSITAAGIWIDGMPNSGGLRGRIRQARNSLADTPNTPVIASVRASAPGTIGGQRAAIVAFLDGDGSGLADRLARLSAELAPGR